MVSGLSSERVTTARRVEAVQPALDAFESCEIRIVDLPLNQSGDYDWRTNTTTGQSAPIELYSGPAQVQVYRFTLTMDAPVGSVDQVRNVRFTVSQKLLGDVDVRKGNRIFITSCPLNPSLTSYQFVVNSGLNSGSPFRRTFETEVDMARILQ